MWQSHSLAPLSGPPAAAAARPPAVSAAPAPTLAGVSQESQASRLVRHQPSLPAWHQASSRPVVIIRTSRLPLSRVTLT